MSRSRRSIARGACLLLLATLPAMSPLPTAAQSSPGIIAYVRGAERNEIHTIDPSGANDLTIWREPRSFASIDSLAWSPDGAELAFSSDHEQGCSTFENDVYVLNAATGLRRVTNAPSCDRLAELPKGSVTVEVENRTTSSDNFFVYVAGAPDVQPLPLGPFGSGTLTFDDVASLGENVLQEIIVTNGTYRWTDPGSAVRVRPTETVHAGTFVVNEQGGLKQHGAYGVEWRGDADQITFGVGPCGPKYQTPVTSGPATPITPILTVDALACYYDRGPTPALANRFLYYDVGAGAVYLATAGGSAPAETLLAGADADFIRSVQWLPDGSGFLFSKDRLNDDIVWSGGLYEYSFGTRKVSQLSSLGSDFVSFFSVSPDGQWVVFERSKTQFREGPIELWVMRRDGTQMRRLVADGQLPSWARR